jgi:4-hydroxybenzoate polyprenyltransferase
MHRPVQWIKNAVVLSAVVFGGQTDSPSRVASALVAVLAFCLVSSAGYIWNDWWDRDRDRLHPEKRLRPIASGRVPPQAALLWSIGLLISASTLSLLISASLFTVIAIYIVLSGAYTIFLKHIPVFDVVVLSIGFVLRAIAGAVAVDVPMSRWLLVCTLLLALFLGFGKRRHELLTLGERAVMHRPALAGYSTRMLNGLTGISAGLTLLAYTGYAAMTPTVTTHWPMLMTVPVVAFAIVRYLFLIFRRNMGGSPESILLHDVPLILTITIWSVGIVALLMRFQVSG